MKFLDELMTTLPEGRVVDIIVGLHWTAAVVEVNGQRRCGLATTLQMDHQHGVADVPEAGKLKNIPVLNLAEAVLEPGKTMTSVGMAVVNGLLHQDSDKWVDLNAEKVIAEKGKDKSVVLIGHFPFVPRLTPMVGSLSVLELNPRPGDHHASTARDIIPEADVLAITSMTILNHTLENLLALAKPDAYTIMLGPTTPLSPLLFEKGINTLCGSVVTNVDPVLSAVRQGANFRQVHRSGVRLVSITKT